MTAIYKLCNNSDAYHHAPPRLIVVHSEAIRTSLPATPGVLTADPRLDTGASLIEEIVEVDHELERVAGAPGSPRGSGGMASKLAAAKMAAWSGVRTVIAGAERPGVLLAAVDGEAGAGTVVRPHDRKLSAREPWIGFAVASSGTGVVDDGARRAPA